MNPAPLDSHSVYSTEDNRVWLEELDSFVPEQLFDAHCHLFSPEAVTAEVAQSTFWKHVDLEVHQSWARVLYPGRETRFLFLGTPIREIDVNLHNRYLIAETERDERNRCHCLVTPDVTADQLDAWLARGTVQGIKPYRIFSRTGDPNECLIRDFLPEHLLEVADRHGAWVTLHLSRLDACADESNLADLELFTGIKYPRIRWILAHCARSFTYHAIRQAIDRLEGMPNIFYDLSAVCDLRPVLTLFQKARLNRIFWGSDGVEATFFHGSYAPLGRGWTAVRESNLKPGSFAHCRGRPILAIYENLLAVKHAAEIAGFGRREIEAVFHDNAAARFDPMAARKAG